MLLMGILFDTGGFQHGGLLQSLRKGAPPQKFPRSFSTTKISAMKLWGKRLKAKFNKETGMLVTAVIFPILSRYPMPNLHGN
jgi:hypothetical protein